MLDRRGTRRDRRRRRDRHRARRVPRPAGPARSASGSPATTGSTTWRRGREPIHACNYLLAVDVDMTPLPGYEFANWEQGYGDVALQPDLATLRRVPWLEATALVLCDLARRGRRGEPVEVSPRRILQRQVERAAALGYTVHVRVGARVLPVPRVARRSRGEGLRRTSRRTRTSSRTTTSSRRRATSTSSARSATAIDGAGVPVEFSKGEAGRGPARDQPRLRDAGRDGRPPRHLQERREGDRGAARPRRSRSWRSTRRTRSARRATSTRACGTPTVRQSLMWDADAPDHLSPVFRGWLGGQIACGRELAWMYAPTVNSYKRYQPESWAPTALAWSVDNRTCGFRIVGHGPSFRLESRIPGADVNPYLAYAATIAAGLHGIEHGLEPPPRFDGNAYAATDVAARPVEHRRGDRRVRGSRRSRPTRSAPTCTTTCSTPPARSGARSTARSPTGNAAATSTSGEHVTAPLVAVTGRRLGRHATSGRTRRATRLAARVPRRGRARGRRSRVVVDPYGDPTRLLDRVDALVLTGGPDVDPALLRRRRRTPKTYGVDRAADDFELALARDAIDARHADARDLPRAPGAQRRARRHAATSTSPTTPASTPHGRPGEPGGGARARGRRRRRLAARRR